jgi:protein-disulfide isomerase/uncharacterized membrane protein
MKITAPTVLFALGATAAAAAVVLGFVGPDGSALFGWLAAVLLGTAGVVASSPRWGTLAGALVAMGAGLYLFWLKVRPSSGPAVCTVNDVIDCDSINDSAYAVILAGTPLETPVSLLGVAFWGALAITTLVAPAKAPRLYQISALFALFNVVVSLYLGSVMILEQKVCVFCVAMYASNLLILWAAFQGMRATGRGLFDDIPGLASARGLWTLAIAFAAIAGAGKLLYPTGTTEAPILDTSTPEAREASLAALDLSKWTTPLDVPLELHGAEPTKGATEPRYILVEFADYACPHCREATLEIPKLLAAHPDVQLQFKAFALDKECNPAFPPEAASRFPQRCVPAYYAECARQQGRFWEVASDIFMNQDMLARAGFPPEDLDLLAKNRGLDMDALQACLRDPETRRMVLLDGMSGAKGGVGGTPAFFLKGVRDDGGWVQVTPKRSFDELFLPIEAHRARAAAPPPTPAPEAPATPEAPPEAPATPEAPPEAPAPVAPPEGG